MKSYEIKFGVDIWEEGSYDRFVKYVLAVEKYGFDSVWAAEAHELDILVKLTVVAAKTNRVKLGTVVLVPALRYPFMLAKTITSLDIVSKGRLILGVGCSDQPSIEKRGVPSDKPVSRMLESIRILKELWTKDSVTFKGQFYQINYSLLLKPVQKPHPPIWIGAYSPRMLRITAELGDGWFGDGPRERYGETLAKIRRMAEKAGRNPSEIVPARLEFTSIADDHETAVSFTKGREYILESGICGNPEEYIENIEKLVKSGARYFILAFSAPNEKAYLDSLRLCAEKVISYFRDG